MEEEQSRRKSFLPEQPPNTILDMRMHKGNSPNQIAQRLSEFAPYGSGETASYMVSNSATVPNQKNTTDVFRSVIKQVGLPAENIKEAKAMKRKLRKELELNNFDANYLTQKRLDTNF